MGNAPEHKLGPDAADTRVSGPQTTATLPPPRTDQPFGASLEPVLQRACADRLSPVNWFRTDWQRGGALTGYATYTDDDSQPQPVVVKLPVPPIERQWLLRLQDGEHVVPRLYASGDALNGYDMAWIVMERLPYGPLGSAWEGREFDLTVEAVGRFYQAAAAFPVPATRRETDWHAAFLLARENVHRHSLAHEQRWNKALKKTHRKLKDWTALWSDRSVTTWCHGDLHLGNAMTRRPPFEGPAVLLDFAMIRPGHWLEDAVYFEHLYWARRDKLGDHKLCKQIAHDRKKRGLHVDPDWAHLAQVKRALLAMSTPAMLHLDGSPPHVEAALQVLEREVGA